MRTNKIRSLTIVLLFCFAVSPAQNFILSSKVELRNWKLTNRAMKSGRFLDQAVIELQSSSGAVSAVRSDAEGNFSLPLPPNGDFTLTINYAGQTPKKYLITTKTQPNDPNAKPQINIAGMIAAKHVKDMNYLGLGQTHVKIENSHVVPRTTINDGEYKLIQKFCTANKLGDMALEKKNYRLAKTFYEMASDIIAGGETYPKDQLKKAEDGLKLEKMARKKETIKNTKTKSAVANQKSTTTKSSDSKTSSSSDGGKSTRKVRTVIGK